MNPKADHSQLKLEIYASTTGVNLYVDGASYKSGNAQAKGGARPTQAGPTQVRSLASGASETSKNGRYRLVMQVDGNLVIYDRGQAIWHTRSSGNPGARLEVQSDGNLVVYSKANAPLWYSRTSAVNTKLILQDDGNLVLYSSAGVPLWWSKR